MVFSSAFFMFAFLPLCIILYFVVPKKYLKARNVVLLLFSLFFYFYGEPKLISIMILSILCNYVFGLLVEYYDRPENPNLLKFRKLILIIAVLANVANIFYFKYWNFFIDNINSIFGVSINVAKIIMPIGISFYTFQIMSYVFDVYYRTVKAQKNPIKLALYITMFPQLIAGPIVRYETIAEELSVREHSVQKFSDGLSRFIYGLGKKMIIANTMGLIADDIFARRILSTEMAWLGAVAYAFQIFYDFSGYSDMAIGLGKIFGFTFLENFNFPYISRSITEFWRRWHISLGTWFRDYVYIPMGGNRGSKAKVLFNIFAVWFLTGFWHGAEWSFIVWGLYFAVILVIEKNFLLKFLEKIPKVFTHIYALFFILIGWIIFRCENMPRAFEYFGNMFNFANIGLDTGNTAFYFLRQYYVEWILALLCAVPIFVKLSEKVRGTKVIAKYPALYEAGTFVFQMMVFGICILKILSSSYNPFIYFRF